MLGERTLSNVLFFFFLSGKTETLSIKPPPNILCPTGPGCWSILRVIPGKKEQAYCVDVTGLPHLLELGPLPPEQNQDSVGRKPTASATDGETHEQKSSI